MFVVINVVKVCTWYQWFHEMQLVDPLCSWSHGAFLFLNHQDHVVGADSLLGFSRVFGMLTNLQGGIQLVNGEVMGRDVINYNDEWFGVIYLVCWGYTIQDEWKTSLVYFSHFHNLASKIFLRSSTRVFTNVFLVDLHFNRSAKIFESPINRC